MQKAGDKVTEEKVAPSAGAWIETNEAIIGVGKWYLSHPVRVRGLKQCKRATWYKLHGSHPVRVRGLKQKNYLHELLALQVAPSAGAWIETKMTFIVRSAVWVAPSAGAWIETAMTSPLLLTRKRRTQCGCVD